MNRPAKLRACADALWMLHRREPQRRVDHLAEWLEQEAAEAEQRRRELETWPYDGPQEL